MNTHLESLDVLSTDKIKNSITVLIGNTLEFFDLALYVHLGIALQEIFFGRQSSSSSLWYATLVFSCTYLARPIGGLIFGYIADVTGRKNVFIVSTIVMGGAAYAITCIPTYEEIGIMSGVVLLCLRMLQAVSSLGEWTGALFYLSETNRDRPYERWWLTMADVTMNLGACSALFISTLFLLSPSKDAWKYPFYFGSLIAFSGMYARLSLRETPEYIKATRNRSSVSFRVILTQLPKKIFNKKILPIFVLSIFPISDFFTFVLCSEILKEKFHLRPSQIIAHNAIVYLIDFLFSLFILSLVNRFRGCAIAKVRCYIYMLSLVPIYFVFQWCQTNATSHWHFIIPQGLFTCMIMNGMSLIYLYPRLFEVIGGYTQYAFVFSLSRMIAVVVLPIADSFVYLNLGLKGVFVFFFVSAWVFLWAIKQLENFEQTILECASYGIKQPIKSIMVPRKDDSKSYQKRSLKR